MRFHFQHMMNLESLKIQENPYDQFETLKSISTLWLHANDISHVSKDTETAEQWATLISKEFTNVHRLEIENGLDPTPYFANLDNPKVFY